MKKNIYLYNLYMVKTRKARVLLPKLRKINYKNRKHTYKLKFTAKKRRLAIDEGVEMEKKKTGKTRKRAAIAKKGRFNIFIFIENIRNQKNVKY